MKYKISEIANLNERSLTSKESPSLIKYLDTSNITKGFLDNIIYLNPDKDKVPSRAKRKVTIGDIIYSTVRPNQLHYGFITKDIEDIIVSTGFTVITPNKEIVNPYYLYCYLTLNEITDYLQGVAENSTTAYPSIKPGDIGSLEIELPSKEIQDYVANLIHKMNESIKNNYAIISNLEELLQSLFKRWFIDFEFPNNEGLPYKSSGGKMVESELGEIPEEWHVGTAKEIFDFSPTEKVKKGEVLPYVEMKNLNSSAMIYEWTNREFSGSGSKFRQGDTLLARITPCLENGKIGYVDFLKGNQVGWGSTEFIIIRSKSGIKKSFSYFFASESNFKDFAVSNMNGSSGRQRVKAETLADYKFIVPLIDIIERYTEITEKGMNFITDLKRQILFLQELKDTLLPKLLSGEIEIPNESVVN